MAAPETYTPFVAGPLPEGVSGAAVLGPIRNFQAKLFTGLGPGGAGRAVPPGTSSTCVEAYIGAFPASASEVLRVFLVTTYLGTVKPGGMSRQPEKADQALAEVATVIEEVVAASAGCAMP